MAVADAFVAFDFETANASRSSACAIGIAIYEQGKVVETLERLIRPFPDYFDPFNIQIHGITANDVQHEPEFGELWSIIEPYFMHSFVVAHNASFDCSVLRASLTAADRLFPTLNYLCTVKVAKKTWPELGSYRLNAVAAHLGFKFKHHNALEDALACGHIVCRAMELHQTPCLTDLASKAGIGIGQMWSDGYRASAARARRRRAAA